MDIVCAMQNFDIYTTLKNTQAGHLYKYIKITVFLTLLESTAPPP